MAGALWTNPWANQVGNNPNYVAPSPTPSSVSKDKSFVFYKQGGKTFNENKSINYVSPGSCEVVFDYPDVPNETRRYLFTLDDSLWYLTPNSGRSKIVSIPSLKKDELLTVRFGVTNYYYEYIEYSTKKPNLFVSSPVVLKVGIESFVTPTPTPTPLQKELSWDGQIPFVQFTQNGVTTRRLETLNYIFPYDTTFYFDPSLSINLSDENKESGNVLTPNYVYTLDDKVWKLTEGGGISQIVRLKNLKVGDKFALRFGKVNILSGGSEDYKQYSQFSIKVPPQISQVINLEVIPAPTPTPTGTPPPLSPTPTPSQTPSASLTPGPTPSPSPLIGSSPTPTPTPTQTPSGTQTPTPTKSLTPTPTPTISVTPSVTPSKVPRPATSQRPQVILPTPSPTPIKVNVDVGEESLRSTFSFSTNKESVSPFIDLQKTSFTFVHNIINSLFDYDKIISEEEASGGFAKARYITKPVKLNSDTTASKFFISFAASIPEETKVRVYYRCFNTIEDPESSLGEKKWIPVGNSEERKTHGENEFIDFEFNVDQIDYDGNSTLKEFDMFSIKIVKESTNDSIIPRIKDFRTIALS